MKAPFALDQIKQFGTGFLPALAVAILPKCPLCWMAILGTFGLGSVIDVAWLKPLAVIFLAVALAALGLRARRIHVYGPLALGAAAAVAIYLFKFLFVIDAGVYLAGATLIGASVWNSLLRPKKIHAVNCGCDKYAR